MTLAQVFFLAAMFLVGTLFGVCVTLASFSVVNQDWRSTQNYLGAAFSSMVLGGTILVFAGRFL